MLVDKRKMDKERCRIRKSKCSLVSICHANCVISSFPGSSVVEGEFRITNQNFWPGLEDPTSEEYRTMAQSIENEVSVCVCV